MNETNFQLYKTLAVALSFAFAVALQRLFPVTGLRVVVLKTWRVNLPIAALNAMVMAVVCGGCAFALSQYVEAKGFGLLNVWNVRTVVGVALSVVALDSLAFFWHRANHRWPLLWRFHAVHHSDEIYDASTAVRFHLGEILISLVVRLSVVGILGLPIAGILAFEVIYAFFNFFEHGSIELPARMSSFLSLAVITPAMHRQHHAADRAQLNTNFGTIFSVWDRVFRTFAQSPLGPPHKVGLPEGAPWAGSLVGTLRRPFQQTVAKA